jgi:hypothetical protein
MFPEQAMVPDVVSKPVTHPAKYSKTVMAEIKRIIERLVECNDDMDEWHIIDTFGGIGGIFDIHSMETELSRDVQFYITSCEIETEWATQGMIRDTFVRGRDTVWCGDFFHYMLMDENRGSKNIVCTSTTYGNRMADKHDATDTSVRNTYKHKLGRDLTEGSSAGMQWGDEYREFHRQAWEAVWELLEPGGYFIMNIKDHIRKGEKQPVAAWHKALIKRIGFKMKSTSQVDVPSNRQGENGEARVAHEYVYVFQKPFTVTIDGRINSRLRVPYAQKTLK